jgi:hypothetical protein
VNQQTPLSVYLPLRVKLLLLGVAGVVVIVGITLGIALAIDWLIGWTWPRLPLFP